KSRNEAVRFYNSVMHTRAEGTFVDVRAGRETFTDYAERWLTTKVDVTNATLANIEGRLRKHAMPWFGDTAMARITNADVREWVAALARETTLSADTIKSVFQSTRQVFDAAELDRVIGRTPMLGVKLPRATGRKEMLFIDEVQIESLADAIDPRYRAL